MDKTIIARSAAEMEEIGVGLSPELSDGMVVSVIGPLGVGKTTLVKGIAKGLLITAIVVSPSYLLAREYHGRLTLHHLDAYRLETLSELVEVGLDQLLPPQDGVTIVEWPDRIDGIVDISDILVRIEQLEGSSRKIQIT